MELEKMNLASMQKLTRSEMKKIMAGSGDEYGDSPKVAACKNKSRYDKCFFDYQGIPVEGKCDAHMASELYCSTLI
ncbi:hypothetical protein [Pedobacter namyangjuensis]|uniref:hypothetical protein n=1 Tax=Pedobacter namyangjuensis TaxID=600626 RepID=UPI000DE372BA|nr:hypothetical protein [Pedobacter namyangjuensis]